MSRRSRRSFLFGAVSALSGLMGWHWVRERDWDDGIAWPFRRMLQWNEKVARRFFARERVDARPPAPTIPPRVNGLIGLDANALEREWRLDAGGREWTLEQLKALPRTECTAIFKCVEGWSMPVAYAGVSFRDFAIAAGLDTGLPYVSLETPDEKYYVGIDTQSMLHAQTVLAYEMNGEALEQENGFPLRLMIPVKYGIKNLKRVGTIEMSAERPDDYWAERGYDWYAGL